PVSRSRTPGRTSTPTDPSDARRVDGAPVRVDVGTRAEPHVVELTHVVEETRERSDAPRPADQAVVQADRHELRMAGEPFRPHQVERVAVVLEEGVGRGPAVGKVE